MAEKKISKWFKVEVKDADLDTFAKLSKNVILMGRRGVGKTAKIRQCFERIYPSQYLIFSAATMDPLLDLYGIPREQKDEKGVFLENVIPKNVRDMDIRAIFIDEANRGDRRIQNAIFELTQFGTINGRQVAKTGRCMVWAAINPADHDTDTYHVDEMDSALLDRFDVQIELPYDLGRTYFMNRFPQYAEGAIDWWAALPDDKKSLCPPRRLEKALEMLRDTNEPHKMRFVISPECNVEKLITVCTHGSLKKKLGTLIEEAKTANDWKEVTKFLKKPNVIEDEDIQKYIIKNPDDTIPYIKNEERLVTLITKHKEIDDYCFSGKTVRQDIIDLLKTSQNETIAKKAQRVDQVSKINNVPLDSLIKELSEIQKNFK